MNPKHSSYFQRVILAAVMAPFCVFAPKVHAQFTSGSDGSYGPINVPQNQTVTIPLPADGIIHATTIIIGSGGLLKFERNTANTPVNLLATGDVAVEGQIDISGSMGGSGSIPLGGAGGPGGFDGGVGKVTGQPAPGDGLGPGGGKAGTELQYNLTSADSSVVGHGSFGSEPNGGRPSNGKTYGSALLIPLVGGSGGGGSTTGEAGGGGGGAILISSTTKISVMGQIYARGGFQNFSGSGSGGAVRLVAPRVEGNGAIDVSSTNSAAGSGRIRIDSIFKDKLNINMSPSGSGSIGGNVVVFPPNLPKLEIVSAAGQAVNPANNQPVTVQIPSGAPAQQVVKVRATNFGGTAKVTVVLTPEFGSRISYNLDIPNPGPAAATGDATVEFPANQLTRVDVWTR